MYVRSKRLLCTCVHTYRGILGSWKVRYRVYWCTYCRRGWYVYSILHTFRTSVSHVTRKQSTSFNFYLLYVQYHMYLNYIKLLTFNFWWTRGDLFFFFDCQVHIHIHKNTFIHDIHTEGTCIHWALLDLLLKIALLVLQYPVHDIHTCHVCTCSSDVYWKLVKITYTGNTVLFYLILILISSGISITGIKYFKSIPHVQINHLFHFLSFPLSKFHVFFGQLHWFQSFRYGHYVSTRFGTIHIEVRCSS